MGWNIGLIICFLTSIGMGCFLAWAVYTNILSDRKEGGNLFINMNADLSDFYLLVIISMLLMDALILLILNLFKIVEFTKVDAIGILSTSIISALPLILTFFRIDSPNVFSSKLKNEGVEKLGNGDLKILMDQFGIVSLIKFRKNLHLNSYKVVIYNRIETSTDLEASLKIKQRECVRNFEIEDLKSYIDFKLNNFYLFLKTIESFLIFCLIIAVIFFLFLLASIFNNARIEFFFIIYRIFSINGIFLMILYSVCCKKINYKFNRASVIALIVLICIVVIADGTIKENIEKQNKGNKLEIRLNSSEHKEFIDLYYQMKENDTELYKILSERLDVEDDFTGNGIEKIESLNIKVKNENEKFDENTFIKFIEEIIKYYPKNVNKDARLEIRLNSLDHMDFIELYNGMKKNNAELYKIFIEILDIEDDLNINDIKKIESLNISIKNENEKFDEKTFIGFVEEIVKYYPKREIQKTKYKTIYKELPYNQINNYIENDGYLNIENKIESY